MGIPTWSWSSEISLGDTRKTKLRVPTTYYCYLQLYRCFSVERFWKYRASTVSGNKQWSWISNNSVFVAKIPPSPSPQCPRTRYRYVNFYYLTLAANNNANTFAFLRRYRIKASCCTRAIGQWYYIIFYERFLWFKCFQIGAQVHNPFVRTAVEALECNATTAQCLTCEFMMYNIVCLILIPLR